MVDFKLISKSTTVNGDVINSSNSSTNIGLILGVSIPLVILRNYGVI